MDRQVAEKIEQKFVNAVMSKNVGSEESGYVLTDFEKFSKIWHEEEKMSETKSSDDKKIELEKAKIELEKKKVSESSETDKERIELEKAKIELEKKKISESSESDDKKIELEKAKIELEKMKIELEKTKADTNKEVELGKLENDRLQIELEKEKIKLERERIQIEKEKTENTKKGVWIDNGTKAAGFVIGAGLTALAIVADHKGWLVSKLGMAISKTKLFA